ncbi:hypothetical protein MMC30_006926 [Trapelia coarctata]|nr:hypothetical protein [Trapelia coarctata]
MSDASFLDRGIIKNCILEPLGLLNNSQVYPYNKANRKNDIDLTPKPAEPRVTTPKSTPRLKLTMPDPWHPSNQMENPDTAINAQSLQTYKEWNSVPWPPLPDHLACLSLQERITFSRVRSRIQRLRDPIPEIPCDQVFQFLRAQPVYKVHPFNCTEERLRKNWGFRSLQPGETVEDDEAPGANNDYARALMAECKHQEQLYRYRITYREHVYSPLVSPMSTSPPSGDWNADDGNIHTGLSRIVSQVEIKADSRSPSCRPRRTKERKDKKQLKRKVKETEDKVEGDMRMQKGIRIGERRVNTI